MPRLGAQTTSAFLGTARRHEPGPVAQTPGPGWRGPRTAGGGVWPLHRRLRNCKSENSEGPARFHALMRCSPRAVIELLWSSHPPRFSRVREGGKKRRAWPAAKVPENPGRGGNRESRGRRPLYFVSAGSKTDGIGFVGRRSVKCDLKAAAHTV